MGDEGYIKSCRETFHFVTQLLDFYGCQQCGLCCATASSITLHERDIQDISKYLRISPSTFIKKYVIKLSNDELGLRMPCPFFRDKKCLIHRVKPILCRTYPFDIEIRDRRIIGYVGQEKCSTTTMLMDEYAEFGEDILQPLIAKNDTLIGNTEEINHVWRETKEYAEKMGESRGRTDVELFSDGSYGGLIGRGNLYLFYLYRVKNIDIEALLLR